jgi:hypothetical protein
MLAESNGPRRKCFTKLRSKEEKRQGDYYEKHWASQPRIICISRHRQPATLEIAILRRWGVNTNNEQRCFFLIFDSQAGRQEGERRGGVRQEREKVSKAVPIEDFEPWAAG